MKSYLNRVDNGGMITHEYVEYSYLSYTQTLDVRDKLQKLDVDCVNIIEVEYSI